MNGSTLSLPSSCKSLKTAPAPVQCRLSGMTCDAYVSLWQCRHAQSSSQLYIRRTRLPQVQTNQGRFATPVARHTTLNICACARCRCSTTRLELATTGRKYAASSGPIVLGSMQRSTLLNARSLFNKTMSTDRSISATFLAIQVDPSFKSRFFGEGWGLSHVSTPMPNRLPQITQIGIL